MIFESSNGGLTWSQAQTLRASDAAPATNFGNSVAFSGSVLFVGSPFAGSELRALRDCILACYLRVHDILTSSRVGCL